ncbi:tyrosine aminotransferase [Cryptococcus neoformans]|nr:tyrosine aminotransferase [Cryptococcus neoformans var. grubii Ze90-1]OXH30466.1 tyrosine aminotransferase [Cryptococcus neoformans var. grubii]
MRLDPNDRDRLINDQESSPIAHANVYDTGIQLPKNRQEWNIRVSPAAYLSCNPIRKTLSSITSKPRLTQQPLINLGLGDPTHYSLHPPPPNAIAAVNKALESGCANGYLNGVGSVEARQAVATYHERWDGVHYGVDNIVLTHGVGQGLDLVFSVLLPPASLESSNILLPRPGFSQYATLLASLGTEIRYYNCIEKDRWETDINMLDNFCDENTRAILITNPNNPCGSNYSREHLMDIISIAEKHKIPIISDEIYGHMTWDAPFIPMASLSTSVPVLTLSGLSKRFLLPGWRFGWVALYDPLNVADDIKRGIAAWGNRFMGPNSLIQGALPELLKTDPSWFEQVVGKIKCNAHIIFKAVNDIPGLSCSFPTGALYVLVRISRSKFPHLQDDVAFATALYCEEAVFVLPGVCFDSPGYLRLVLASPANVMEEVVRRLRSFCHRNHRG